ncbi:hypothetical protein CDAR_534231 [Caerostris darwini]|uniref:Uncharacterized protein n=1 Tax=Caerostris darwini TaxID=1538125 RepID=A0AAV4SC78_9ARAC|nr:hypothetical protein CDAR_534231 [Caerostris darwini]
MLNELFIYLFTPGPSICRVTRRKRGVVESALELLEIMNGRAFPVKKEKEQSTAYLTRRCHILQERRGLASCGKGTSATDNHQISLEECPKRQTSFAHLISQK